MEIVLSLNNNKQHVSSGAGHARQVKVGEDVRFELTDSLLKSTMSIFPRMSPKL